MIRLLGIGGVWEAGGQEEVDGGETDLSLIMSSVR